jgi:hypothetical protein
MSPSKPTLLTRGQLWSPAQPSDDAGTQRSPEAAHMPDREIEVHHQPPNQYEIERGEALAMRANLRRLGKVHGKQGCR